MHKFFLLFVLLLTSSPSFADDKIGKFELNGVTFKIPREYLWQNRGQPDGKAKDGTLYLMTKWVDKEKPLIAASSYGDQRSNIEVTITDGRNIKKFNPINAASIPKWLNMYYIWGGLFDYLPNDEVKVDAEPIYISYIKKYDLTYYKLPKKDKNATWENDFYIRGNPLKPDYWIRCQNTRCYSSFLFNDKIIVSYSFQELQFLKTGRHDDARKKIINLLNSFIKNNNK